MYLQSLFATGERNTRDGVASRPHGHDLRRDIKLGQLSDADAPLPNRLHPLLINPLR